MALHPSFVARRTAKHMAWSLLLCGTLAGCGLFGHREDNGTIKPLAGSAYADPNAAVSSEVAPSPQQSNKKQEAGAELQVNKFLWRGALETLGFMPFVSADPFGGVIVTDWSSPPGTSNERFKITAYVLGRELRTDGVKVAVFRQVKDSGQWVDAPVNPSTANDIEAKILARARELRAAAFYK